MEAKKSKNSAICAKRSEDPQSKGEGFKEPPGGYMNGDPGIGDGLPSPSADGQDKPYPHTTWMRSGGLQERMAIRRYVVHSRSRRIRVAWLPLLLCRELG